METLVDLRLFKNIYKGKTVLVTGHTGFKGSWLVYWLKMLGSRVIGYSLEEQGDYNHFNLLNLDIESVLGNIGDAQKLEETFIRYKPDMVFHLAAQALVLNSYENPLETYETNLMGTLKILEACKKANVKVVINITSDKVYENKEWEWAYRENDELGGYDPYSSSKACMELLVASYRSSYFNLSKYKTAHATLLASCRAGNVIGGGDWSLNRLLPDIVRAAYSKKTLIIRNPKARRPWQHVLESLSAYLLLGQKLQEGSKQFSGAWNFGPSSQLIARVEDILQLSKKYLPGLDYELHSEALQSEHEAGILKLDSSKALAHLNWHGVWDFAKTLETTINWYKSFYATKEISTKNDLYAYISAAKKQNLPWTS